MTMLSALQKARILKANPGATASLLFMRNLERKYEEKLNQLEEQLKAKLSSELKAELLEDIRTTLESIKRTRKGDKGDQGAPGARIIERVEQTTVTGPRGLPGRDADDEVIAERVLGRVKLPEVPTADLIVQMVIARLAEQKLTVQDIEGLATTLSALNRNIGTLKQQKTSSKGSGGGGMGNVQHQVFDISAGTASVQTTFPIAGNGNAIFKCAYQGQELHMTTHFTIGTDYRTITFTAAVQAQFVNNTTIGVTYVRG